MREYAHFGEEISDDHLHDHEAALKSGAAGEEGGQAHRQVRIEHAFDPSFADRRHVRGRDCKQVECLRHDLRVEVASADHDARWIHRRIRVPGLGILRFSSRPSRGIRRLRPR